MSPRIRIIRAFSAFLALVAVLDLLSLPTPSAFAADTTGGREQLLSKYPAMKPRLEKNQFGEPITLESNEVGNVVRVDMYGIIRHPFEQVKTALENPPNWCEITSLHINVKACTYRKLDDHWLITLYNGRKYYQPPADAKPLRFTYSLVSQQPQYFDLLLTADEGPLQTRDHRMRLEAAPLDAQHTFVHFSYAYSNGRMARIAIRSYFATIARNKVGFSVVREKNGKYYYVNGVRGSIERNTVRYYLALETYLDTMNLPEGQRFERRISRWYDLSAKYPRQLKEMEKGEYLAEKRREHLNQITLQNQITPQRKQATGKWELQAKVATLSQRRQCPAEIPAASHPALL